MAEPLICSWTVFGIDYDERIQIFFQGNDHIKAMMSTRTTRGVCLVKVNSSFPSRVIISFVQTSLSLSHSNLVENLGFKVLKFVHGNLV